MNVTDKASALAFLDRLIADPLNPELCKEFGIEIVPAEIEPEPEPEIESASVAIRSMDGRRRLRRRQRRR